VNSKIGVRVMLFNAIFNNISVLLVEESGCTRRKPPTCLFISPWCESKLTTFMEIEILK
jgi:hypothetical protein